MSYIISCIHADREDWVTGLRTAILQETNVAVDVLGHLVQGADTGDGPRVAVYLASQAGRASMACEDNIRRALAEGVLVVPCVERLADYVSLTPDLLHPLNGLEWGSSATPPQAIVHALSNSSVSRRSRGGSSSATAGSIP